MTSMNPVEQFHWIPVLYPAADAFAGTVNTDIVNCESAVGVLFQITKGVGLTGTSTITIDACDDVTPSNTTAVGGWRYRSSTTPDTWSAWAEATATGFTTTVGSNQLYQIFVPAAVLAAQGYGYVRLTATEVANNPVLGGVNAAVVCPRYQPVPATLLT